MNIILRMTAASLLIALCVGSHAVAADAQQGPAPAAYYGPDTYDFPQTLVSRIPDAVARRAEARMLALRANAALTGTFRKMRFMNERTPDFRAVTADEKAAFAAYQAARESALSKLAGDPQYAAVVRLRDEIGDRLEALRGTKGVKPEHLVPLAEEKLNYAGTATAMEAKALAGDPAVAAARDAFVAAGTRLADARVAFDDAARYHADVEAARERVADAKVHVVTTAAYADALVRVSDAALDYAYHLHRYDRGNVGTYPVDYYGYGYSGYSGYSSKQSYRYAR